MKEDKKHHSQCPDEDDQPCDNRPPHPCPPTQVMACSCRCGRGVFQLCLSNYSLLFRQLSSCSTGDIKGLLRVSKGGDSPAVTCIDKATCSIVLWPTKRTLIQVRWRQGSQESDNILGDVLLEVQRLWPPFFGGRRICNQVRRQYYLTPDATI